MSTILTVYFFGVGAYQPTIIPHQLNLPTVWWSPILRYLQPETQEYSTQPEAGLGSTPIPTLSHNHIPSIPKLNSTPRHSRRAGAAEARGAGEFHGFRMDLRGQFPCGRQQQRAGGGSGAAGHPQIGLRADASTKHWVKLGHFRPNFRVKMARFIKCT